MDRDLRKRNSILFDILEEFKDYWELENFVCAFLNEKLHLNLTETHFDFIRRLGTIQENMAHPILFGLTKFRTKLIILKNSPKRKLLA